jgi:hypothetical protein
MHGRVVDKENAKVRLKLKIALIELQKASEVLYRLHRSEHSSDVAVSVQ